MLLRDKMKKLLQDKKAISIIIGYVLLIVILLAVSILVYSWLKGYIPGFVKECPETALIIQDYSCDSGKLDLVVKNQGLFNIDGFYLRASQETGELATINLGRVLFAEETGEKLEPGQDFPKQFDYTGSIKVIEIQPFVYVKNQLVLCEDIVKRDIDC